MRKRKKRKRKIGIVTAIIKYIIVSVLEINTVFAIRFNLFHFNIHNRMVEYVREW